MHIKALPLALPKKTSEIRCDMSQLPRQPTADMARDGRALTLHNENATHQVTDFKRKPLRVLEVRNYVKALSEDIDEEVGKCRRNGDRTIKST